MNSFKTITTTLCFALQLLLAAEGCTTNLGSGWSTVDLASSIDYKIHHKVVGNVLHMRLDANHANGRWLGFGFAEQNSGHMKGSDMVTASIDGNGDPVVEDRYATFAPTTYTESGGNGYTGLTAKKDLRQDYTVVCGKVESSRMEIYVTRALDTGDKQDRVVENGSRRVIWSYGAGSVGYHGANRGAMSVTFVSGGSQRSMPSTDGSWVRRFSNYTIPTETTTYACQSFSFPTDADRHVVAIKPIINEATKSYPHHAILHVCQSNTYWNAHTTPNLCSHNTGNPGSSPLGQSTSQCSSLMWSWAVGLGDFILPNEAGFLIGNGASKISHVILEIHYDNPSGVSGAIDSAGFEAFYVETLRSQNAAGMTLGDPTASYSSSITSSTPYEVGALPIDSEKIHRQATCPSSCTQDLSQEITVFSGLLHMHHFGEKMYTDLYNSSGNFVKTTNRIDFWDNGFQQMRDDADLTYKIKPGDSLQTHCWYNTKGRDSGSAVAFGPATGDEMCMDFIFYYPAQYRGKDSANNDQLFAFCGARVEDSVNKLITLCGGMGQENNGAFIMDPSGQVNKGNTSYQDPLEFGKETPLPPAPSPTPGTAETPSPTPGTAETPSPTPGTAEAIDVGAGVLVRPSMLLFALVSMGATFI